MTTFKKILLGVDLSQGDWQVSDHIPEATQSLVKQAAEVAKAAGALLHLRAVVELDEKTKWLLDHYGGGQNSVLDRANDAVNTLVLSLQSDGVDAQGDVALGKAWVELARYAHQESFDVVLVGTKQRSGLAGWMVGSTGRYLLRSCGTPVWVHKETTHAPLDQVLVATDYSDVGDRCLELGVAIAAAENATLHLLHVAQVPSESLLRWGNVAADKVATVREHAINDARAELDKRAATIDKSRLKKELDVHLLSGNAADVISDQVKQYKIDLLVMGTQTHHKEMWHMMGSTAERLLNSLECSMLAVKPSDFRPPVT